MALCCLWSPIEILFFLVILLIILWIFNRGENSSGDRCCTGEPVPSWTQGQGQCSPFAPSCRDLNNLWSCTLYIVPGKSKSDFRVVAPRQNDLHRVSDIELSGRIYISSVWLLAILQIDLRTKPCSVWSGSYQLCFIYLYTYIQMHIYCVLVMDYYYTYIFIYNL